MRKEKMKGEYKEKERKWNMRGGKEQEMRRKGKVKMKKMKKETKWHVIRKEK